MTLATENSTLEPDGPHPTAPVVDEALLAHLEEEMKFLSDSIKLVRSITCLPQSARKHEELLRKLRKRLAEIERLLVPSHRLDEELKELRFDFNNNVFASRRALARDQNAERVRRRQAGEE